jgi:hypothetical protein
MTLFNVRIRRREKWLIINALFYDKIYKIRPLKSGVNGLMLFLVLLFYLD